MLQWTGGSRRKVATTRKSTYNRQRQYFEQKKRQQQTCRPQNYEYGKKKRIDDSEGPRSLDVLNLKNFTSSPQCCSNDHNGDNIFDVPKSLPAFQSNKTFPMYCYQPTDTRTGSFSNSHYEVLLQNKLSSASNLDKQQSIHNHCDGVGIRFGERKTQITSDSSSNTIKYRAGVSVLDLLNDDGYKNNSSVSSSHEAHVAFSVEGLGKIGLETPVRSPTQTTRVSFGDQSPYSKSLRWLDTSNKDEFVRDDIRIEFDLGKSPKLLGKTDIMSGHSGILTDLNFRKDGADSDVFSNLTSKNFFGKRKGIHKPAMYRDEGTHKDRFCLISQENNKTTWKDEPFYIDNNHLNMEDKKIEMHIDEFEDIYWRDRRNKVETHEVSSSSENHAPSFNHLQLVKDQDLVSFDWERYPRVNQALYFEDTTESFHWSFPDTKDAVDNLNFQSDESRFLETDWHEGTNSLRSKSVNIERNSYDRQNKFWMRSDKEYGAENILLEKIKYDKLDDIENNLEGMWTNSPRQKKSMQGDFWKKLDGLSSFEEGFGVDLVPSNLLKTSQIDSAFFDNGILSKDDPLDVLHDNTAHHPIDFSHRVSKPSVRAKQDTSDVFFSEENHCKRQKSGSINLMKAPPIYPFKANDEDEIDLLFSSEVNKFPDPSIWKNLNKGNDSESGFLFNTCHENSQERVSSVGESAFSSKTLTVLDSADNCTKDKEPKQEIPEGPNQSESPKAGSPQSVGTPIVDTEEPLNPQENLNSNASNDHIVSAPTSLSSGDKGKETLNMNEENVSSKELGVEAIQPSRSEDPAYKVMLESYVLQLLCVQKVLMNSSMHDKLKKI